VHEVHVELVLELPKILKDGLLPEGENSEAKVHLVDRLDVIAITGVYVHRVNAAVGRFTYVSA
jgi:hypothetical protein